MYVFVLSSSINGLCHHVGYKNFDNTATNIRFLALLTGGEGLHNNHHGYPRSPKFSWRTSEIDPAWPLIKLLIALQARQAVQDDRRNRDRRVGGVRAQAALGSRRPPTPSAAAPASSTRRRCRWRPLDACAAVSSGTSGASASSAFQCSTTSGAPP